jgi:transposase
LKPRTISAVALRVAERHEISTGLLFTWRRQLMAQATAAAFVPVQIAAAPAPPAVPQASGVSAPDGGIEIDLPGGIRVRAGHGADLKLLRGVLAALDAR